MKTIHKETIVENIIEKSKFIGYIKPACTVLEAEQFINAIKKKHWDANHNVPVYVIGPRGENQKCSDDGEPSGTSGPPVMQMLIKEEITDVVIVITRYFGGIKLGTGGLVRAYTSTAKLALEAAGMCQITELTMLTVRIEYTFFNKLQNLAPENGFEIVKTEFLDAVEVVLSMTGDKVFGVKEMLSELTGGAYDLLDEHVELAKVLIDQR